jgi:hypothetical protein
MPCDFCGRVINPREEFTSFDNAAQFVESRNNELLTPLFGGEPSVDQFPPNYFDEAAGVMMPGITDEYFPGVVLNPADQVFCIDIDKPKTNESAMLQNRFKAILEKAMPMTYRERSMSGNGEHWFYRGYLEGNVHLNYMDVQIFSDQYIALTGDTAIEGCTLSEVAGAATQQDYNKVSEFLRQLPRSSIVGKFADIDDNLERAPDKVVLERMLVNNTGRNANRIRKLWLNGGDAGGDRSAEDFELLNALESFSGNKDQVKRLFMHSVLARDIGRKGNHADKYLERSIVRAFNKRAKDAARQFLKCAGFSIQSA